YLGELIPQLDEGNTVRDFPRRLSKGYFLYLHTYFTDPTADINYLGELPLSMIRKYLSQPKSINHSPIPDKKSQFNKKTIDLFVLDFSQEYCFEKHKPGQKCQ
ncbi:MAG: hypothetical protein KJ893_04315, partial [Candidatus Omnitrophica bacterium]|nr:hypothetical protein [Candidatus Omnitrophota bacterium]